MNDFTLSRNSSGRLVLHCASGELHENIAAVRAFPISSPGENISLLDAAGHELRWINKLDDVPEASRTLIAVELAQREFMPEIRCILQVSSFATPSKWQISTDRGDTELLLKTEDHIRRLSLTTLLITDGYGVSYIIRDVDAMDKHSRKLLDRFL
jgi:hypothetical protein